MNTRTTYFVNNSFSFPFFADDGALGTNIGFKASVNCISE